MFVSTKPDAPRQEGYRKGLERECSEKGNVAGREKNFKTLEDESPSLEEPQEGPGSSS